ncbi:hypothetical protein K9L97_04600 [Candidatus Woesearchaeota archaeon]|nr:hypothetical protein [Candidatus Woesearchaeota archaeon]
MKDFEEKQANEIFSKKKTSGFLQWANLTACAAFFGGFFYLQSLGDKFSFDESIGFGTYSNKVFMQNVFEWFNNVDFDKPFYGLNFLKNEMIYFANDAKVVVEHKIGETDIFRGGFVDDLPDRIVVYSDDNVLELEKEVLLTSREQTLRFKDIPLPFNEPNSAKFEYLKRVAEYNQLRHNVWESERLKDLKRPNNDLKNYPVIDKNYSPEYASNNKQYLIKKN